MISGIAPRIDLQSRDDHLGGIRPSSSKKKTRYWHDREFEAGHLWGVFEPRLQTSWEDFEARLVRSFKDEMKTRSWSSDDLRVMRKVMLRIAREEGEKGVGDGEELKVVKLETFRCWWNRWYYPILSVIRWIRPAWEMDLVKGVAYSKKDIEKKIKGAPVGTFMLRLSANNPGCVILGFVSKPEKVYRVLIESGPFPRGQHFRVEMEGGTFCGYKTLDEVILSCKHLKKIFPDRAKKRVFKLERKTP
mmetsp:Transcript_28545/g.55504  ORF Transcript_28545/g.55504 Transcript_28545/m.55504 type:complete len:247 (+) Transcript_28545:108-848(+)